MITFVVGTDSNKRNIELKKLLQKVDPLAVCLFDETTISETTALQFIGGTTLFQDANTLVYNFLFENPTWSVFFEDRLELLAKSDHHFIFIEQAMSASLTKKAEKYKSTIIHIAQKQSLKSTSPRVFALTDVFCTGNKKRTWLTYHQLVEEGITVDEMIPALFWSMKTMAIVRTLPNTKEGEEQSGMKSFPFKKAKQSATTFTPEKERIVLRELVSMYHEGHRGTDMSASFELFILRILQ